MKISDSTRYEIHRWLQHTYIPPWNEQFWRAEAQSPTISLLSAKKSLSKIGIDSQSTVSSEDENNEYMRSDIPKPNFQAISSSSAFTASHRAEVLYDGNETSTYKTLAVKSTPGSGELDKNKNSMLYRNCLDRWDGSRKSGFRHKNLNSPYNHPIALVNISDSDRYKRTSEANCGNHTIEYLENTPVQSYARSTTQENNKNNTFDINTKQANVGASKSEYKSEMLCSNRPKASINSRSPIHSYFASHANTKNFSTGYDNNLRDKYRPITTSESIKSYSQNNYTNAIDCESSGVGRYRYDKNYTNSIHNGTTSHGTELRQYRIWSCRFKYSEL